MGQLFRGLFCTAFAAGGVWCALWLLGKLIARTGETMDVSVSGENTFFIIPIGIVGAILGAALGSMLLPRNQ